MDLVRFNDEELGFKLKGSPYFYNGMMVPRVTEILSTMLHEDYLMGWACYIGRIGKQYKNVVQEAADKGSFVHGFIEDYLKNGIDPDFHQVPTPLLEEVNNAFNGFLLWWENLNRNNTVYILMQEVQLVTPWFGGTLDLLLSINGKIFLIDFKTSNHPSYKYFYQLAAYRFMLNMIYGIDIDGTGIVMLNKKEVYFDDSLMLDFSKPNDQIFINNCHTGFMTLLEAYYSRLYVEQMFNSFKKSRKEC